MYKKISFSGKGQRADIGDMTIFRIIPNRYTDAVGPFVFLDHIAPRMLISADKSGTGPHPHRVIATLTYVLNGEGEHFDSMGNHARVHTGGIQWMKAGSGILHDESLRYDTQTTSKLVHCFQFWINLPAVNKTEKPEYLSIPTTEVPQKQLPDNSGLIKIVAGKYEDLQSKIPEFSRQFLYYIHLHAGKQFEVEFDIETEVAAFLPLHNAVINDAEFNKGEFIEFDRNEGSIVIVNNSAESIEIILFGGESYTEPIVAKGPFVMNSHQEIADCYRDYYAGKYGEIKR